MGSKKTMLQAPPQDMSPFAYRAYRTTALILAFIGLTASLYLAHSHYRNYTDLEYQSFCAISQAINCDTVSQSPYSVMLGLPVPLWGVVGYGGVLLLLVLAVRTRPERIRGWLLVFWCSLGFSLVSIVLALVSTFLVRAYCLLCLLTYGVNFSLALVSFLVVQRCRQSGLIRETVFDIEYVWKRRGRLVALAAVPSLTIAAFYLLLPGYWHLKPTEPQENLPTGVTAEGYPYIGAADAPLTIEMFSDYQCFQCRKLHYHLRQLIANHPRKARLVHRHFPMDHEVNPNVRNAFHVGSGKLAMLAIYAASKGKFLEMNDLLFEAAGKYREIDLGRLARRSGLPQDELMGALRDPEILKKLMMDIRQGTNLALVGTPSFVVDGRVYRGSLPKEIVDGILQ